MVDLGRFELPTPWLQNLLNPDYEIGEHCSVLIR